MTTNRLFAAPFFAIYSTCASLSSCQGPWTERSGRWAKMKQTSCICIDLLLLPMLALLCDCGVCVWTGLSTPVALYKTYFRPMIGMDTSPLPCNDFPWTRTCVSQYPWLSQRQPSQQVDRQERESAREREGVRNDYETTCRFLVRQCLSHFAAARCKMLPSGLVKELWLALIAHEFPETLYVFMIQMRCL